MLYGSGGGEIQYDAPSDSEIRIHYLSELDPDDSYVYVDHDALPACRGKLEPLPYATERLFCALAAGFDRTLSDADEALLAECDGGKPFRVGGPLQSCQGKVWQECHNPRCDCSGGSVVLDLIAIIPANTEILGDVWGAYADEAEFCFGLCSWCGAVYAVNRCT